MAVTAGVTRPAGFLMTSTIWNQYMGAGGNMDILGAYTTGYVMFADSGQGVGKMVQSSNLQWDNTNKRLGIFTSPSFTLHVVGQGADNSIPAMRITYNGDALNCTHGNTNFRSAVGFLTNGQPYVGLHAECSATSNQWRNDGSGIKGLVLFHDQAATPSLIFRWNGVATASADFSSTVDALSIRSDGLVTLFGGLTTPKLAVTQTATSGVGVTVQRNLGSASTDSPLVYIDNSNASDDQPALVINSDISGATNGTMILNYSSTNEIRIGANATDTFIIVETHSGFVVDSPVIRTGRNSSNTYAGTVNFLSRAGTNGYIWCDDSGVMRIFTSPPSPTTGDLAGTVIGSQTSQLSKKNILHLWSDPFPALKAILETPVVDFVYRNGAYNQTKFTGIVSEWSPEFTMDQNKVFNPVSAFGYTVEAIKALDRMLTELERKWLPIQQA